MKKIIFVCFIFFSISLNGKDISWQRFKKNTLIHQNNLPGWCSKEKAKNMMDLIYETKPDVCVEIGVFGGSSIYPTAKALKFLNKGIVYAIDPWRNNDCTKGYQKDDPNYIWWNKVNLEKIYRNFKIMLNNYKISSFCSIMRMTSEEAVKSFENESIDILHIDGNHSEEMAFSDVLRFLPKVKKGGYVWFDDANWSSTNKAVLYLKKHLKLNKEYSLKDNSCLLFQKY